MKTLADRLARNPATAAVFLFAFLTGCAPTKEELERTAKLAKVQKIAVVALVGKSSVSPQSDVYKRIMDDVLMEVRARVAEAGTTVEFVPLENVAANQSYQQVAKIEMPDTAYSPVSGLTYLHQGVAEGFDAGPLTQSLGVDALLSVVLDIGADVRNNGSQYFMVTKIMADLTGPPQDSLWALKTSEEEYVDAPLHKYPKLNASISGKWIVMMGPSAEEYAQIMDISRSNGSLMPKKIAVTVVDGLVKAINKARETVEKQTAKDAAK